MYRSIREIVYRRGKNEIMILCGVDSVCAMGEGFLYQKKRKKAKNVLALVL